MTKVALVAGASGGIGMAVVRRLAAEGVHVVAGYHRNEQAAKSLVVEMRQANRAADSIHLDVRDPSEIESVCDFIVRTHGSLDILVNCAAINIESPALGMDDDTWNSVLQTNLSAAFSLARAAAKPMLVVRNGRIVMVSSVSARMGGRGQICYAAAKAGLESMVRVLALELGRKGVLVNCVAPGVIETDMSAGIREQHRMQLLDAIALRRFGKPEEVADAVAFLCSEAAEYITGSIIRVDGGMGL